MTTLLDDGGDVAHPHILSERALDLVNGVQFTPLPTQSPVAAAPHWQMLAQFASQHHASSYSRLKYGPRGSSSRYIPLSVQTPDVFEELRLHQIADSNTQAWWIASTEDDSTSDAALQSSSLSTDILAAMDELVVPPTAGDRIIKTSATHPINISTVITPEAIPLVSSHVVLSPCPSGCGCRSSQGCAASSTICEIAPSFTLDRLPAYQYSDASSRAEQSHLVPPVPGASHIQTRTYISQALQAAMSSGLQQSASALPNMSTLSLDVMEKDALAVQRRRSSVKLALSITMAKGNLTTKSAPSSPILSIPVAPEIKPPLESAAPPFRLGNMLLSSCPGKKVRLEGPIKGRSAVCRDLEVDLRRIKSLGVGCVVCCLADPELEFLGSPWPDYEATARKLGLDVLRLPTPEGLPPSLYPSSLDEHLTKLISKYTLNGVPVLVHCRGGVGRAGVVACCWMIRVGLCGTIPCDLGAGSTQNNSPSIKTLEIVRKAIDVVRVRRSTKAIETYEQVKFLVEYVDYLRTLEVPQPF
ncbi:phosphatases II [Cylindrobasidium torrendii FP15055 ss-10]|uniref:Phosphatases II n=1 Tax=Cylindrobasidium torrendii FP15055 ss-10 TaxID=1314674 RepID=A0A0D7BXA2_9AGAR|nr:phosphatases II [Cylindrobasidium torrendii FP15055 ss-10]